MNLFGIAITPGHVIIGALLVLLYDAIFTWPVSNDAAAWWFARVQGWLKLAIYAGVLGLVTFIAFTPWPWNLVLVLSIATCVLFFSVWLKNRKK